MYPKRCMHLDKRIFFYDSIYRSSMHIGREYCDSLGTAAVARHMKKKVFPRFESFIWYQPAHVLSYKI